MLVTDTLLAMLQVVDLWASAATLGKAQPNCAAPLASAAAA
jgi:hypothetical protein